MELFKNELTQMPNVTTVLDELKQDTAAASATAAVPSAASQSISSGKQKKKPPYLMIALISVSVILLIVIAILLFSMFGGSDGGSDSSDSSIESSEMSESSSGEEGLTAPNTVGRNYESLRANNPWDYVTIEMAGEVFDETISEGTIASQDPEPGTPIQKGTIIRVYVSRGAKMREIPNVAGMTSEQALSELEEQGFNAIPVQKSGSNVPNGQVIETDPPAGQSAEYGSEIFVFVSNNQTSSSSSQPSSSTPPPESSSSLPSSSEPEPEE